MALPQQNRNAPAIGPQITVVATFADDCGPCHNFKTNQLGNLRTQLTRRGIRLVEKTTPKRSGAFPADFPAYHVRHILGFPSFVVYPSRDWDAAVRDRNFALSGKVYNGRMGPHGRAVEVDRPMPYTAEQITSWAAAVGGGDRSAEAQNQAPPQTFSSDPYGNCTRLQYVNTGRLY